MCCIYNYAKTLGLCVLCAKKRASRVSSRCCQGKQKRIKGGPALDRARALDRSAPGGACVVGDGGVGLSEQKAGFYCFVVRALREEGGPRGGRVRI
jgi:hypothetical protein